MFSVWSRAAARSGVARHHTEIVMLFITRRDAWLACSDPDAAPPSRRRSPESCKDGVPRKRERGMPGARCTRGLVCKIVRVGAHEHTGSAETLRHPPRNGFTAYGALFPATSSFCHRHCRLEAKTIRLNHLRHRQLDTSNGCRNHTLLPYAAQLRQTLRRVYSPTKNHTKPALAPFV